MPLQDWEPSGTYSNGAWRAETEVEFDRSNDTSPTAPTIDLKIKDVFDVEHDYEYSEYRLKTYLFFSNTPAEWLNPACYEAIGELNNYRYTPLAENGTEYTFIPQFENLSLLANGEYLFFISFALEGLRITPSVFWHNIENYVHTVKLTIFEGEVTGVIVSPYEEEEKAFTLDPKFFTLKTYNTDTYFQVDAVIKITKTGFVNTVKQYIIPQKAVPFNTTSQIVLGKTIHKLMQRVPQPNVNYIQYILANLTLIVTEKKLSDDTEIRTQTLSDLLYVAGLSCGFTGTGFLDFNVHANRATPKSFAYLNFIVADRDKEIRVLRNGTYSSTIALADAPNRMLCKKVFFKTFTPGDVIDFVIVDIGAETNVGPKKTYYMLPEGKYSNMLVWENEFLTQSAIECTGTAQIKGEVEFQSQKTYDLFVEVTNHLSTSKEVKLTINTGWLIRQDNDTIESLMRSKRVWLLQGNNFIQLRPIGKGLPGFDTEAELISYPLEFLINRNYDEETYTL